MNDLVRGFENVVPANFIFAVNIDCQVNLENHLDEVNQIAGLVSIFETNPKTLFRNHVSRLRDLNP